MNKWLSTLSKYRQFLSQTKGEYVHKFSPPYTIFLPLQECRCSDTSLGIQEEQIQFYTKKKTRSTTPKPPDNG